MPQNIDPALERQALAVLLDAQPWEALDFLQQSGLSEEAARDWFNVLPQSSDPLTAAIVRTVIARQQEAQQAAQEKAAEEEALLARGLKHDFPEGSLDLGLALLFYPAEVPQLSLSRAAHLCRLSNSLFAIWRQGETDEAGARAIVRSGSPGYSEASYERAWDNARMVSGG
ncbi:hypothetical protein IT575_11740 [bacterium]|nr:hypothetical protein [bacterium]